MNSRIGRTMVNFESEASWAQAKLRPLSWCLRFGQSVLAGTGIALPSNASLVTALTSACSYLDSVKALVVSDNGMAIHFRRVVVALFCLWLCRLVLVSVLWRLCILVIRTIVRATPLGLITWFVF